MPTSGETRLSVVAESDGSTDDDDLGQLLRPHIPVDTIAARVKQLGESAAEHRQAAEQAQIDLEALTLYDLEQCLRAMNTAWRELRHKVRALERRAEEIAHREREFEKHRQALDGLRGALGIGDDQCRSISEITKDADTRQQLLDVAAMLERLAQHYAAQKPPTLKATR